MKTFLLTLLIALNSFAKISINVPSFNTNTNSSNYDLFIEIYNNSLSKRPYDKVIKLFAQAKIEFYAGNKKDALKIFHKIIYYYTEYNWKIEDLDIFHQVYLFISELSNNNKIEYIRLALNIAPKNDFIKNFSLDLQNNYFQQKTILNSNSYKINLKKHFPLAEFIVWNSKIYDIHSNSQITVQALKNKVIIFSSIYGYYEFFDTTDHLLQMSLFNKKVHWGNCHKPYFPYKDLVHKEVILKFSFECQYSYNNEIFELLKSSKTSHFKNEKIEIKNNINSKYWIGLAIAIAAIYYSSNQSKASENSNIQFE